MQTRAARAATIMAFEDGNIALVTDFDGEVSAYEAVAVTDGHIVHTPRVVFSCQEEVRFSP